MLNVWKECSLEKNRQTEEKTKSNVEPNDKRDEVNPLITVFRRPSEQVLRIDDFILAEF